MNFKFLKKSEKGQSFVEYCLILGLVSIVIVAALTNWGSQLNSTKNSLNKALNGVNKNISSSVAT
ncbi:MAG: Flp family type IVb pilin [Cyanobacteriota bacterium]